MFLWFGCFAAAAVAIGMVQGLFFWLMLALRFWWVIFIGVVLYYAYTGAMAVLDMCPAIGHYWHYVWPALIGSGLRMTWLHYHPPQQRTPPIIRQQKIE